jgi:hypothetical protein
MSPNTRDEGLANLFKNHRPATQETAGSSHAAPVKNLSRPTSKPLDGGTRFRIQIRAVLKRA